MNGTDRTGDHANEPGQAARGLRILVVEDQGFQRWMLEAMLQGLGAASVVGAGDGIQALDVLSDSSFDIIFCDLDLPAMDGMEFIRHFGEMRSAAELVVCTAMDEKVIGSVEAMSQAYGVRLLGTVRKPATPDKLKAVLARRTGTIDPEPTGAVHFTAREIEDAIARGEIEAFFQPKVGIPDGVVVGVEALARWRHPHLGLLNPGAFVPVLEAAGRIDGLFDVIAEDALSACRRWWNSGLHATVAINLSLRSLSDPTLVERLLDRVERNGLEPLRVTLEITESAEAEDLGRSLENLSRMRMRGFGLSIDDYGTGYSSLLQLSRIPFTELKIDRSFVRNALRSPTHRALLETSLDLTRRLHLTAVAEGVETAHEWNLLLQLACPVAQGYYVCEPKPPGAFEDWVLRRRHSPATGTHTSP